MEHRILQYYSACPCYFFKVTVILFHRNAEIAMQAPWLKNKYGCLRNTTLWTYQAIKPEQQRSTLRLTIYPFTLTSLFPLGKTPPCPLKKIGTFLIWLSTPTYTTQPKYTQISRSKSIFSNPQVSGKCPNSFLQCLSWLIFPTGNYKPP